MTDDGGEDDMEYCKIGGCDREQHVDSQDGMCLPCGVAYESGWHDCFDEKVRGVRGRQEIEEKYEEISELVSEFDDEDLEHNQLNQALHQQGISYLEALEWVLGEVDDL